MSETKKLLGKVAVITGGTTGIGLAAAKLFVKEGAYVFITGRRQKELDEAVQAIGSNITGIQGDVAKLADLDRVYEAVKWKGRIDVVFANAGVAEFAPLGKITEEHFAILHHDPRLAGRHEFVQLDFGRCPGFCRHDDGERDVDVLTDGFRARLAANTQLRGTGPGGA